MAVLLPAEKIIGNKLCFVNASVADAAYIVKVRTEKGKYLSSTPPDITLQENWLRSYREKGGQAYFIIVDKDNTRIGTVRLYDAQGDSFCWGSWILDENAAYTAAIESALMVYHYALSLGFKKAHFDVRKENKRVWQFHERFGAQKTEETDLDYFYSLSNDNLKVSLKGYARFLPRPIEVIY
jgi:RimJ/RimL family protein N-acetyltransferase